MRAVGAAGERLEVEVIPFFKRLFLDDGAFIGFMRAAIMGIGGLYERMEVSGQLPAWFPPGLGIVLSMLAMMFRSSQSPAQDAQMHAVSAMTKHRPVPTATAEAVQGAAADVPPAVEVKT